MSPTRRDVLVMASGGLAAAGLAGRLALADRTKPEGRLALSVPTRIHRGQTFTVTAEVVGARSVTILVEGKRRVAGAFGPGSTACTVATRLTATHTHDVVAVAEMTDGSTETACAVVAVLQAHQAHSIS